MTLAEIPFVRLREGLPDSLLEGQASYSATVHQAQRSLGPPELLLDPARRRVRCGGVVISLSPANFAFLAWFARRALADKPAICRSAISTEEKQEFLSEYRHLTSELSNDYERAEQALRNGMDCDYFDHHRSLLHKQLRKALGRIADKPYRIGSDGRRPQSCYALRLKSEQIRFANLDKED